MAKKSNRRGAANTVQPAGDDQILPEVDMLFKRILRVMSWVVGICFTLIITLPNFKFDLLDISIKIIFYIGVFTLLLFIIIEFFGDNIKKQLSRTFKNKTTV